jgi:glycolate oxidase iron-sulfur subunit
MQTSFTPVQRADPKIAEAESILRKCVHCGFCTATCPTYVTLGNELDSPRGRIYLIKDMLENGRAADKETVTHIDRCLSCLACTTTCPSGVDYMHLIDHARAHIEDTYKRPLIDRLIRQILAFVLPYPKRFRTALKAANLARLLIPWFEKVNALKPFAAMLRLAPTSLPQVQVPPSVEIIVRKGHIKGRVAVLSGCAQSVLAPGINVAAQRLLTRLGIEVVIPKGEGCCGALVHHMGKENAALAFAKANIDAWESEGLDAIIITTSGCGTTIKDYGHMLKDDPDYAAKAARISNITKDITEYLVTLDLPAPRFRAGISVAYHSACSLQHGQKITQAPKDLLTKAGFVIKEPAEGHLCCGSAGTYNILQPEIATTLRDRKVKNIERTGAVLVAAGNIGCITQIASASKLPVLHTVELLEWAYSGVKPETLV